MSPRINPQRQWPDWMRSIRVRYTVLYSAVLFSLAALLVGSLYLGLSIKLRNPVPQPPQRAILLMPFGPVEADIDLVTTAELQRQINSNTLDQLRDFSFIALGVLFVASLGVGWVIAGQVLAPIARISQVARDIQATDLGRRIRLHGPDDELKRLADTFDDMLDRLDAAFQAQQRFIADASHELRNPLAVIRTNIDVTLGDERATVEDLRATTVVVRRASDRMAGIVDDLLQIARRQVLPTNRDPVDLASVLTEEADEFQAAARKKNIVLERVTKPDVWITGDRDELKRAVANLVENAIRYTPARGRVRVACGRERSWAWLAVIDNGPGIAPEHHEHVFDRFWRADKARSRAEGGTGLGLAIVREIARSHGGEVQLRSTLGQGTTFVLWLPLAPLREQPAQGGSPTPATPAPVGAYEVAATAPPPLTPPTGPAVLNGAPLAADRGAGTPDAAAESDGETLGEDNETLGEDGGTAEGTAEPAEEAEPGGTRPDGTRMSGTRVGEAAARPDGTPSGGTEPAEDAAPANGAGAGTPGEPAPADSSPGEAAAGSADLPASARRR